ncbi:MAG: tRNA (adenosine(37)-N6)-threonylcarbamoyltransferase complex ATPase subunit type 1 TsaE [Actinomycetota bacterium]
MSDSPPIALRSPAVDDTRDIGEALAPFLRPGDVVSLVGELGAGKTAFVQGAARGLGVETQVASPTFVLVRDYEGRLPVHHVDVYRLGTLQEVIDLGFEEMIDEDAVTFVEWGSAVEALFADRYLEIHLTGAEDSDERRITLTTIGDGWGGDRWPDLARALVPWSSA